MNFPQVLPTLCHCLCVPYGIHFPLYSHWFVFITLLGQKSVHVALFIPAEFLLIFRDLFNDSFISSQLISLNLLRILCCLLVFKSIAISLSFLLKCLQFYRNRSEPTFFSLNGNNNNRPIVFFSTPGNSFVYLFIQEWFIDQQQCPMQTVNIWRSIWSAR